MLEDQLIRRGVVCAINCSAAILSRGFKPYPADGEGVGRGDGIKASAVLRKDVVERAMMMTSEEAAEMSTRGE
jgi:hypothetical protein